MPLKSHRYSLGTRLFFSAAVCCVLILVLAGVGLTTFYRRSAERGFDERLSVYIKQLVADLPGGRAYLTKNRTISMAMRTRMIHSSRLEWRCFCSSAIISSSSWMTSSRFASTAARGRISR